MGFKDFVLSKFDELKTKFKLKNEQYQGSNADQLANSASAHELNTEMQAMNICTNVQRIM